jgi:fibronectin type 3 domain-containing protein
MGSIPMSGPAITTIEALSSSSVKVTWAAVTGATGYELWRSTSKTGTYTRVYAGTAKVYTNTGRTAGVAYYYKVCAYKTVEGTNLCGAFGTIKIGVALAKPTTPRAVVTSRTSVTVSWTAIKGVTGYELWRSTKATGTYTRIYRGTAKTFLNRSLKTGTTYYYKLRVYKKVGSVYYYGPYSAYRMIRPR